MNLHQLRFKRVIEQTVERILRDYLHTSHRTLFEFAIIFLTYTSAQPTRVSVGLGAGIGALGVLIKIWAIGYQRRERKFFVRGPYRFVRHPFYLGSFLFMFGLTVMGGNAWVVGAYLAGISLLLMKSIREEEQRLRRKAGPIYQNYSSQVSAFIPQIVPGDALTDVDARFSIRRGLMHGGRRGIDSLLGLACGVGLMSLCVILPEQQWFHIATGIFLLLFVGARVVYYRLNFTR